MMDQVHLFFTFSLFFFFMWKNFVSGSLEIMFSRVQHNNNRINTRLLSVAWCVLSHSLWTSSLLVPRMDIRVPSPHWERRRFLYSFPLFGINVSKKYSVLDENSCFHSRRITFKRCWTNGTRSTTRSGLNWLSWSGTVAWPKRTLEPSQSRSTEVMTVSMDSGEFFLFFLFI